MNIKEMREIIKADKETKDVELSDRDVVKVFQYLKDRDSNRNYDGYIPRLRTKPYIEIFYEDLCNADKFTAIMEEIDDFIDIPKLDYSKLEDTRWSLFLRKQQVKPISEVIINYQDFEEYDKDIIF